MPLSGMSKFADLIDAFPSRKVLASQMGVSANLVRVWRQRGTIPPKEFPKLITAARSCNIDGVTLKTLHDWSEEMA